MITPIPGQTTVGLIVPRGAGLMLILAAKKTRVITPIPGQTTLGLIVVGLPRYFLWLPRYQVARLSLVGRLLIQNPGDRQITICQGSGVLGGLMTETDGVMIVNQKCRLMMLMMLIMAMMLMMLI